MEHDQYLRTVLQRLGDHKLHAKFKKREFWLTKVAFLGHIVSQEGISVDPCKTEPGSNWSTPMNVSEMRSLLGLVGYYRRFLKDLSKIASPLTELTRKEIKYEWSQKCERRFQELKTRLTTVPILTLPKGT